MGQKDQAGYDAKIFNSFPSIFGHEMHKFKNGPDKQTKKWLHYFSYQSHNLLLNTPGYTIRAPRGARGWGLGKNRFFIMFYAFSRFFILFYFLKHYFIFE